MKKSLNIGSNLLEEKKHGHYGFPFRSGQQIFHCFSGLTVALVELFLLGKKHGIFLSERVNKNKNSWFVRNKLRSH